MWAVSETYAEEKCDSTHALQSKCSRVHT
ncbi:hypothetical protein BGLA2_2300021 [Burkholderia gladioli]|nr:hypothetical protein BGLA2_2300021 [Burkholderia gladioli]